MQLLQTQVNGIALEIKIKIKTPRSSQNFSIWKVFQNYDSLVEKYKKAVEKNVGEGSIYRIKVENLKPKDLGGLMEMMGVVTIL